MKKEKKARENRSNKKSKNKGFLKGSSFIQLNFEINLKLKPIYEIRNKFSSF